MDTSTNSTSTVSSSQPADAQEPENIWSIRLRKWLLYRLFTALVWYWIILIAMGKEMPFAIPVDRILLALPFLLTWIGFLVAHKWLHVFLYLPYLLLFPLLIVANIAWGIFQFFRRTFTWPARVFRAIKSGEAIIILLLVVLISWSVSFLSGSVTNRAIGSLIALAGTYLLVIQSFRWAANPYMPLLAVVKFLSEKGRKIIEDTYVKPGMTGADQKRDNAIRVCDWALKALDQLYQAKAPLSQGLTAFTHRSLLPSFVLCFIVLYATLASSFSLSLFHVERAWGPLIDGIGEPRTLFSYFYFSFLSQATAVPDGIRPLSVYGQIWILWVVMTGILLLTILIALFTASVGVHGENALSEVRIFSEDARRDLTNWKGQLLQPVLEAKVVEVEAKVVETRVEAMPAENEEMSISLRNDKPVELK